MKTGPSVRLASSGDIDALVTLMREFYAESGYALDPAWAATSFETLFSDASLGSAWIAEIDREPVGHAVLTLRHSMERGGLVGSIDDLFVRPAFRRRRVATTLIAALVGECVRRNVRAVEVEVGPDNDAARALYASHGLRPVRERRLHLVRALAGGGEDGNRPGLQTDGRLE